MESIIYRCFTSLGLIFSDHVSRSDLLDHRNDRHNDLAAMDNLCKLIQSLIRREFLGDADSDQLERLHNDEFNEF